MSNPLAPASAGGTEFAEPCAIIVFGASGDLTQRKLAPALFALWSERLLDEHTQVIGFARTAQTSDEFRARLRQSINQFGRVKPLNAMLWERFARQIHYLPGQYDDPQSFLNLKNFLAKLDPTHVAEGRFVFYLALPGAEFPVVLRRLSSVGLLSHAAETTWPRVVMEKPFGQDLESACDLNRLVVELVGERHIFRIDHYMAKETVQNILVLRFANSIFEPIWNRRYVDHVQITAAETIGIEGRGHFYEQTGVVRDIIQNHLLAILALVAMEPPLVSDPDSFRDKATEALRSVRCLLPQDVATQAVHGQYRGYCEEPNVSPASTVPTFAALKLYLDNWRWQGVPFYLRAGKRLAAQVTEAAITFRSIPLCLFATEDACSHIMPNVLTLRVQPNEGVSLHFTAKVPGDELEVKSVAMDFLYKSGFDRKPREAYERVLLDAMRGDQTLFWRSDGVETAWRIVSPLLEAWNSVTPGFPNYDPGSQGPKEADDLLRRDQRRWRTLRPE